MLTHIDLFSGIGGFALASQWAGFKTVAFVEIEPYAQEIIKQRFGAVADAESIGFKLRSNGRSSSNREGQRSSYTVTVSSAPRLYSDIFAFDGTRYRGATLLTGGFPCQPFSQAGKRRGKEDDRYLWPEMLRVIHEARPAWVVGENVAGIVTMELDRVLSDLEGEGYAVQSLVVPACAVDAKHRRDRVWIVGHAEGERVEGQCLPVQPRGSRQADFNTNGASQDVADASGERFSLSEREAVLRARRWIEGGTVAERCRWLPESDLRGMAVRLPEGVDGYSYEAEWEGVPRVAAGVKNRVQRLKGLGNSIQPQVCYEILRIIAEIEK